jgi:hypothetical protein
MGCSGARGAVAAAGVADGAVDVAEDGAEGGVGVAEDAAGTGASGEGMYQIAWKPPMSSPLADSTL